MKKYNEHSNDLHMVLVFVELEKAYHSVPREIIWKIPDTQYVLTIIDIHSEPSG